MQHVLITNVLFWTRCVCYIRTCLRHTEPVIFKFYQQFLFTNKLLVENYVGSLMVQLF